jgi:hypothetical protein
VSSPTGAQPSESVPNWQAEAHALAATLQGIIDGAVHPDLALRRVMVDLKPVRAALARYRAALGPPDARQPPPANGAG